MKTPYVFSLFYFQGPDRFSVEVGNAEYNGDYIKAGLYNNEQLYQRESNEAIIRKRRQLPNQPFLFGRGENWFLDKNLAVEQEIVSIYISLLSFIFMSRGSAVKQSIHWNFPMEFTLFMIPLVGDPNLGYSL